MPIDPQPPEHPVATHDGLVWPLPRAAMRDPAAIDRRIREDAARIVARDREDGVSRLGVARLTELGWTESQVIAHAATALAATKAAIDRIPQGDVTRIEIAAAGSNEDAEDRPDIGELVAALRAFIAAAAELARLGRSTPAISTAWIDACRLLRRGGLAPCA